MKAKTSLSRRGFLRIVAAASIAGITAYLGLDRLSDGQAVSRTRALMGTVVNITALGENAAAAVDAALEHMAALEAILTRFQPQSQLSQLNRAGRLLHPHPALVEVLRQSFEVSRLLDGAFDVSVKPLLDLYQQRPGRLPASQEITAARNLIGWEKIVVDERSVHFLQPKMSVTLDGIAKGYIVDAGAAVLRLNGCENVLVEAGGDLMSLGLGDAGLPWKIGLQAPRQELGKISSMFSITNRGLATSGDYEQPFTPDFAHYHIIDPRTGDSSPELSSASIFAPTAAQADAWATAVMAMGRRGLTVIEDLRELDAYVITKDMEVIKTSGL